ncbi:hypothetical protein SS1G_08597 [Sclerotinia sclerotiorum 1980 UF-70]|uniref:Uncharacterized protein n=1 Tax=Sclerotinia sclerotiorum (strain ATCC 18683 / 1980 / Ss-1) TaxID=665079 RepID=A7ETE2_SCLS1|nr:hypothetical protein SS1G_08597 [Sclerotinia sclerotiorum 1980 UF-70]EDN92734.1 hypothetical protein SS1G_08597 [Sclerotinia sclerotiorum 1980 UF-70]
MNPICKRNIQPQIHHMSHKRIFLMQFPRHQNPKLNNQTRRLPLYYFRRLRILHR